jgi:zinc D-Ala-D-Ala dipeptidase
MTAPRFDQPCFTCRPADVGVVVGGAVAEGAPLPALVEPADKPLVTMPSSESLVPVEHRRIRVLGNYWHAGWDHAVPGAWLRSGALERLATVADSLPDRFGLAVFDAWRPLALQSVLYNAAYTDPGLPPGFVSYPDTDAATPPPHLTGGTVDLSLTFDGAPLALGTGFDDFTDAARSDSWETIPGVDCELRRMLFWRMRDADFVLLDCEWWHFEFGTRRWAAIRGTRPIYGPATLP